MIENDIFAQKLKTARMQLGLSQRELSCLIGYSRDNVTKWESGRSIPRFPDILSLCTVLHKPLTYFANYELADNVIPVVNSSSSEPLQLHGITEIYNGWCTYQRDYDIVSQLESASSTVTHWEDDNIFLHFIHQKTGELCAIRDFGRYCPESSQYLFSTDLLPLNSAYPPHSPEELLSNARNTLDLFRSEISLMCAHGDYPLFLIRYCGINSYYAWSITENKPVYVYDYKEYLDTFLVSEARICSPNEIIENDKYTILPPSEELIKALGLELSPAIWQRKRAWDEWHPRPSKTDNSDLIPEEYLPLYQLVVYAINLSRSKELGYDEEFDKLEGSTVRFERMCSLGVPSILIEREISLMRSTYDKIPASLLV